MDPDWPIRDRDRGPVSKPIMFCEAEQCTCGQDGNPDVAHGKVTNTNLCEGHFLLVTGKREELELEAIFKVDGRGFPQNPQEPHEHHDQPKP